MTTRSVLPYLVVVVVVVVAVVVVSAFQIPILIARPQASASVVACVDGMGIFQRATRTHKTEHTPQNRAHHAIILRPSVTTRSVFPYLVVVVVVVVVSAFQSPILIVRPQASASVVACVDGLGIFQKATRTHKTEHTTPLSCDHP